MALHLPCTCVASYTLDLHGLKVGLLIGCLLNAAGAWIRYSSSFIDEPSARFALAFVGQLLAAIAQPFVLNAAPKIANEFFAPGEQRTVADAIMNLANPVGAALALVIGPAIVAEDPGKIPMALLVSAIVATVPLPFAPFVFGDAYRNPEEQEVGPANNSRDPISFRKSLNNLLKDKTYLKLAASFGVAIGLFNAYVSELSFVMSEAGYTEDQAGYVGFATIACGLVGSIIAALLIDKLPHVVTHERVYKTAYSSALGSFIILTILCTVRQGTLFAPLMLFAAIFGFGAFAVLPTGLELAVEVTYGWAGEAAGTGGLWTCGQVTGLVMSVIMDGIRSGVGEGGVRGYEIWLLPGLGLIGTALGLWMTPTMRRREVERRRSTGRGAEEVEVVDETGSPLEAKNKAVDGEITIMT